MSNLYFPRIHFRGFARVNVPTGNRNIVNTIDNTTNSVYMDDKPFDINQNPKIFHDYLQQIPPKFNADGKADPDGDFNLAAGYNFYGNNHFSWENTKIVSFQCQPGIHSRSDPIIGSKIELWGHYNEYLRTTFNRARWVDIDPTMPDTAQIFAGQLTIKEKNSSPSTHHFFSADINCVHSVRWFGENHIINQSQHFLSGEFSQTRLFQFSIPKNDKHFLLSDNTINSPCLTFLSNALKRKEIKGLIVQYVVFNMSSPKHPNTHVFYDLIGTISLWDDNQMSTTPCGRILYPQKNSRFGPISVQANQKWVSCYMPTALPFSTREPNPISDNHPTHRLGQLQAQGDLELRTNKGTLVAVIPEESYKNFWDNQGFIDVPLLNKIDGVLSLSSQSNIWNESTWEVHTDTSNFSLEAPDIKHDRQFSQTIDIFSYFQGQRKSNQHIPIYISDNSVVATRPKESLSTDVSGKAKLTVYSKKPGTAILYLGNANNKIIVKVLADDWHLEEIPIEKVDYHTLYKNVMAYYELVYPFMSDKVFSMADQCKCETYARLMWQMCDPKNKNKSYYMPSTREMSQPQSILFLKYLKNIEQKLSSSNSDNCEKILDYSQQRITSKEALIYHLKRAIDLELSIMQQYLYAAYSLPNYAAGKIKVQQNIWTSEQLKMVNGSSDRRLNSGWRGTILEIAHEEMIHYLVANNLLMSLGEPFYTGEVLIGQRAMSILNIDTEFSFEPFSEHVLSRFVRFEWPNYVPSIGRSIANFYQSIRQAFIDIPNLYPNNSTTSGGEHHLFLNELTNRKFPAYQLEVNNTESALFAIDFISQQGEGVSPDSAYFEHSHFARLRNISTTLSSFKLPFEPANPCLRNPVLEPQEGCNTVTSPQARILMKLYNQCYEFMFALMTQHFSLTNKGSLRRSRLMNAAIDIMAGLLRPLSIRLMNEPSGVLGRTAGPPIPNCKNYQPETNYSIGCKRLAIHCQSIAHYCREMLTDHQSQTYIELLEFYYQHLQDLSTGKLSREA
ncbi:iminophenyl-pyruvate dimer synthase VioB [Zooshikella marina]|uniref:iminophenyl-pyruvate dimer synthase VioB n=1 Tax=Zooshikella ganghwensis TaxID=202772 RepID=UPI001BAEC3D6|nr:iminophenyl-pyruvate dimer synthase VioB [Zooshikella ganghwensis]MBU2706115.1 iminophenyl-pyruvate dimer synthase VioB [Zooshikella ganghwensis]